MKQHQGIWLPDHEEHLTGWMTKNGELVDGKGTYQIKKLRKAMEFVKQFGIAVDVGAHCGMWSMQLAKRFFKVVAFEPVAEHRECWNKNMNLAPGARASMEMDLYPVALGEKRGRVSIRTTQGSSGDSYVQPGEDVEIQTLDSYGFTEYGVDFIKLDCEGYEYFALKGGEETLKRWKPCVHVEQKPGKATAYGLPATGAVDYLQSLGAKLRMEMSGDFILSWDD